MEGAQIHDVIEHVLKVEAQARETVSRAEKEARDIVLRAGEEARQISEKTKHKALEQSQKITRQALDEARRLRDERIAREVRSDQPALESSRQKVPEAVERVVHEVAGT